MGTPPRRRRIRKLRLLALLTVLFLLAAIAFAFGLVTAVASEIPKLDPANRHTQVDSVIYAAPNAAGQRRVLAVLTGDESRVLVDSDEIAPIMRQAIVAVEDKRFYEHNGVDLKGILRALWEDIRSGKVVEGGSTITQQFVKNAYVRNEKTIARKVREAALAWQLTQKWSKERILTAYLNTIYFGNGAYGIQRAANTYFGKGAKRLTLPEAALLAGLPSDPSTYDPVQHPAAAKTRRLFVLDQLHEQGRISTAELLAADGTPLPRPEDVRPPGKQGPAAYFVNYVKDQLVAVFGAARVFGGGLEVTTTIDLDLQERARAAIEKVLDDPGGPAAALVAIDPRTGAVKAMFGGTNFRKSQFNLATQAERQPGSSFKPIVLATAFRQGISPETTFVSRPVAIDAGDRIWRVTNYDDAYLGSTTLGRAMVSSDNSVYAQLTKLVSPRAIVNTAHELGIRTALPAYFSIGLGAVAVNPLDMTRAYATIANDGRRVDGKLTRNRPRVIEKVRYRESGKTKMNVPVTHRALGEGEARELTAILQEAVRAGTGRRAALPDRPVAGKTGTTDNYGDAWFVGYTPQLVTAVWVGYPNALRPMTTEFGGQPVVGGTLPALVWKEFMGAALEAEGAEPESFASRPYLAAQEKRIVNRGGWKLDNGFCPGTRLVAYFAGRGPTKEARCYPNEVTVPRVIGMQVGSAKLQLAAKPLGVELIGVPASPGKRAGIVVRQEPRPGGFLSAAGPVRLWVTRPDPRYGLVPNLVGSSVRAARDRLRRLQVRLQIVYGDGPAGLVLRQTPQPGVAAGRHMRFTLVVARATSTQSP
jgi:penicillin-binding protein 1A